MKVAINSIIGWLMRTLRSSTDGARYYTEAGVWCEIARGDVRYHNGTYAAHVSAERLTKGVDFIIYASILKSWLPPHETELLTAEQKEKVIRNVQKFISHSGLTSEVG
jgi:hypothetical protein